MDLLRPKSVASLAGLLAAAYAIYYIVERIVYGIHVRRHFHDIPSLPRHWLFGNLIQAGDKLNPSLDRHPDYGLMEMWKEISPARPPMFLLDIAPVNVPLVVIVDPRVAEQIAQPSPSYKYSMKKSESGRAMLTTIGTESMLMLEGEEWRDLRKRFNKGFAPAHLHTLSSLLVDKIQIFVDRLQAHAKPDSAEIKLQTYAQDLTTDIITTMVIEKDFGAQSVPEGQGPKSRFGFLTVSRKLPGLTYKIGQGVNFAFLDPIRPLKAWWYERIQNQTLDQIIREQLKPTHDNDTTTKTNPTNKNTPLTRSIVQLALSGLQPTTSLIHNTRSQIKTFLFAGQDTTATVIQWLCWELSQESHSQTHAESIAKLRAEHDSLFGPDPSTALTQLSDPATAEQILGSKLPYTTAFIKETMRLHPPAGTARENTSPSPQYLDIDTDTAGGKSEKISTANLRIYICHYILHRNPSIWGPDASQFKPSRWLDESYMRSLPVGAFRPFERGPRNCIGQELAMLELKIVLVAIARVFEFEKVGLTGREGDKEVYSVHHITAVPVDGMSMRIRVRES